MSTMEKRDKRVGLHLQVQVQGQDVAGKPFQETTRTLNISGGGILFESESLLNVGSRLVLKIELPPPLRKHFRGRATYHAKAVVCRVEKLENQATARIGARFLGEVES
jgi:c-di-GMP-binding flagellar brake protein YcgR